MRKVTANVVRAVLTGDARSIGKRDGVTVEPFDGGTIGYAWLHNTSVIEVRRDADGRVYSVRVRTGGWNTQTTRERLNGLPGVRVRNVRFEPHLNGKPWDGHTMWEDVTAEVRHALTEDEHAAYWRKRLGIEDVRFTFTEETEGSKYKCVRCKQWRDNGDGGAPCPVCDACWSEVAATGAKCPYCCEKHD